MEMTEGIAGIVGQNNSKSNSKGVDSGLSGADWMEQYWKRIDGEKQRELRQERGQRIAQSLTDLGQSIGDIIQASGGATVLPRDVEKNYADLNKQQQQIYDTYWARMDALRKEKKADDAAAAKEKKADAAMEQAQKNWEREMKFKEDNANEKNAIARLRAAALVKKAETTIRHISQGKQSYVEIPFNSKKYPLYHGAEKTIIPKLYKYLNDNGLIMFDINFLRQTTVDRNAYVYGYHQETTSTKPTTLADMQLVVGANLDYVYDNEHIREIDKILKGGKPTQRTEAADGGQASEAAATQTTGTGENFENVKSR